MEVRWDLVADGLGDADYDSTSVAYGLSRLEVRKVIKAIPLPKVAIDPVESWRVNYVDKDKCQMSPTLSVQVMCTRNIFVPPFHLSTGHEEC